MRQLISLAVILASLSFSMNDEKIYKGKFEKKQSFKKNGQPIEGGADYFFSTKGESYFVKFTDPQNGISPDEVESLNGEKVKVKGFLTEGLWDTDDPNVQSRIGTYFVITDIIDS